MGLEVALGLGIAGAAGLYGAKQQDNANKNNQAAVQTNTNYIRGQAQSMMLPQGGNPYQNALMQFIGAQKGQTTPAGLQGQTGAANINLMPGGQDFATGGPDAGVQGGGSTYGFGGITQQGQGVPGAGAGSAASAQGVGGSGGAPQDFGMMTGVNTYNPAQVGQGIDPTTLMPTGGAYGDAISQMTALLGKSAPGYEANANVDSALNDLLSGHTTFDNSQQFAALAPIQQRQQDQALAQLHGSFGSLGQRFGTSAMQQESQLRSQMVQNQALQNAQIAGTSFENSQNRRIGALGVGAQREQAASQIGLQGYQARLGGLGQLGSLGLQRDNSMGQLQLGAAQLNQQGALANQAATNQAGQFNAQAGNDYTQYYNNYMMQALGLGNSMQQGNQNYNLQLLALMNGQQLPQQTPSAIPGAIGDLGQLMAFLPFLNSQKKGG